MENNNSKKSDNTILRNNITVLREITSGKLKQAYSYVYKNQKIIKIASYNDKKAKKYYNDHLEYYYEQKYPKNKSENLKAKKLQTKNIHMKFLNNQNENNSQGRNLSSFTGNNQGSNFRSCVPYQNNSSFNISKPKNIFKGSPLVIEDSLSKISFKNHKNRKRIIDRRREIKKNNNSMKTTKSAAKNITQKLYNNDYYYFNNNKLQTETDTHQSNDLAQTFFSSNQKKKSYYNISNSKVRKSPIKPNILKTIRANQTPSPNKNDILNKNYLSFVKIKKICKNFFQNNDLRYKLKDKKSSDLKCINHKIKNKKIEVSKERKNDSNGFINKTEAQKNLTEENLTINKRKPNFVYKKKFICDILDQRNNSSKSKNQKKEKNCLDNNDKYKFISNDSPKLKIMDKSNENSSIFKSGNKSYKNKIERSYSCLSYNDPKKNQTSYLFYNHESSKSHHNSSPILSSNLSDSTVFISNFYNNQNQQFLHTIKLNLKKNKLNIIKYGPKTSPKTDKNNCFTLKDNNDKCTKFQANKSYKNSEINIKNDEKIKNQNNNKYPQEMNPIKNIKPGIKLKCLKKKINKKKNILKIIPNNKILSIKKINNVNENNYDKSISSYINFDSFLPIKSNIGQTDVDSDAMRIQDQSLLRENPYRQSLLLLKVGEKDSADVVLKNVDLYKFTS